MDGGVVRIPQRLSQCAPLTPDPIFPEFASSPSPFVQPAPSSVSLCPEPFFTGFSFNEGGITSANITWWGLQRYISDAGNGQKDIWDDPQFDQPIFTVVDEQTRTVQIRWAEGTQLHPQYTTSVLCRRGG